jgi:hypothetical protein
MIEAAKTEAEMAGVMASDRPCRASPRHGTGDDQKFQIGAVAGQILARSSAAPPAP